MATTVAVRVCVEKIEKEYETRAKEPPALKPTTTIILKKKMNGQHYEIKTSALMSSGKTEEIIISHFISEHDAEKIVEAYVRRACCDEDSTIVEEASQPLFDDIERAVQQRINDLSRELGQECFTYVWDAPAELWHRARQRMLHEAGETE